MKSCIALGLILLLSLSCKTQEEIGRDQMMNNISIQMVEVQKLSAEAQTKMQTMEELVAKMQGKFEEQNHQDREKESEKYNALEERFKLLEQEHQLTKKQIVQVLAKLEAQDKFLKKILSRLDKKGNKKSTKKKPKKKKKLSKIDEAMKNYRAKKYKLAKTQLSTLLNGKKLKKSKVPHVIHNLGMIAFIQKNNDDAMIYFSRLFTEHPKSRFNGNGLLFLAKTFNRSGQKENAKQTLEQLIQKYPKAKQVKEAKKLLAKLK